MFPKELVQDYNTVIVSVLNWGLGHACRSIPIIETLIEQGKQVIIASDGMALELLQETYSELPFETLPEYNVHYKSKYLAGIILRNASNVAHAIIKERLVANRLVKKHNADLIISDSRFGFRSNRCKSVIISHQLNMQANNKFLHAVMNIPNRILLNKFDEVWVPDFNDHRLTGELSKNMAIKNTIFIGPQSSLTKRVSSTIFDLAIILSGPEPARSQLENQLIRKFEKSEKKIVFVRGTRATLETVTPTHWKVYDIATREEVESILHSAKEVISRSGYTSIMDYYLLGINASLIPTPGQSEQAYLAEFLDGKFGMKQIKDKSPSFR